MEYRACTRAHRELLASVPFTFYCPGGRGNIVLEPILAYFPFFPFYPKDASVGGLTCPTVRSVLECGVCDA